MYNLWYDHKSSYNITIKKLEQYLYIRKIVKKTYAFHTVLTIYRYYRKGLVVSKNKTISQQLNSLNCSGK